MRELDQRYRTTETAVACLHDSRDSGKVKHDLLTWVRQRLFAIALGYEDNNDAALALPTIDLLATLLKRKDFRLCLSSGHIGSQRGLVALRQGRAHLGAGIRFQTLLELIRSPEFKEAATALGGYDLKDCGKIVWKQ